MNWKEELSWPIAFIVVSIMACVAFLGWHIDCNSYDTGYAEGLEELGDSLDALAKKYEVARVAIYDKGYEAGHKDRYDLGFRLGYMVGTGYSEDGEKWNEARQAYEMGLNDCVPDTVFVRDSPIDTVTAKDMYPIGHPMVTPAFPSKSVCDSLSMWDDAVFSNKKPGDGTRHQTTADWMKMKRRCAKEGGEWFPNNGCTLDSFIVSDVWTKFSDSLFNIYIGVLKRK